MNASQQRVLLRFVRQVVGHEFGLGPPPVRPTGMWEDSGGGAFVTLKRGRRLRGCMGVFCPSGPLPETLDSVARSACRDPRFKTCPVTADEVAELSIELSVLSVPQPIPDPSKLETGRHGIIVRRGDRSGCFLPQVAVERGWGASEFLTQCCLVKAKLPSDAWREPGTEVLTFSAEVFVDRA